MIEGPVLCLTLNVITASLFKSFVNDGYFRVKEFWRLMRWNSSVNLWKSRCLGPLEFPILAGKHTFTVLREFQLLISGCYH